MTQIEIEGKIRALKEYKLLKEDLETQITSIEDEIKAEMTIMEINELVAGPFKVRWTPFTSARFDTMAFRKAHEDIYNLFAKPVESRRFSVA